MSKKNKAPAKSPEQEAADLRLRAERLNRTLAKALAVLQPPSDITVTQWAERYRRLASESSAEAGLFRVSRTPYLKEVMDALTDVRLNHVVLVAASQVGKSEVINNFIGYAICEDPSSILFVQPVDDDVKDYTTLRIDPMIRDCPELRRRVAEPKSRSGKNTYRQKAFPGGLLTMCGATEAHALAGKPIRYLIGDERDRWVRSAGKEGDPWGLARRRQTTFYNAMAFESSTPTIKGDSPIADAYELGTMERYHSQCPHCGKWNEIRFKDIKFTYDRAEFGGKVKYTVNDVWYACPHCGAVSDERTMKKAPAKWIAEDPGAIKKGCRSFWLTAFVSPWMGWEEIVQEFLDAKASGDPKKMQVVFNTIFGELWENRGDMETADDMLARREDYGVDQNGDPVELPEGVLVLTLGIDTQDNRLEYEVVGHGFRDETWGIEYGTILGRPDSDAVWEQVDALLDKTWHYADGLGIRISIGFMDEGGHFTQTVREQCDRRLARQLYAIKGLPGQGTPFTSPPKKMAIMDEQQQVKGYCWQYQIGVDAGKTIIMSDLKVQEAGKRGYCHFPARDDYGPRYFNGLLSETLTYDEKLKQPWVWKKLPGHERNEPLDIRNYNLAAIRCLRHDMAELDRKLKEARGVAAPLAATRPARTALPQERRVTVRQSAGNSDLSYDPW